MCRITKVDDLGAFESAWFVVGQMQNSLRHVPKFASLVCGAGLQMSEGALLGLDLGIDRRELGLDLVRSLVGLPIAFLCDLRSGEAVASSSQRPASSQPCY